ncbi:Alpha-soluble NSF attachment protein, partial [Bienertia sinuspersici]
MVDFVAKSEECNNKADNIAWKFIGSVSKYEDDDAEFYQKAANSFKISKSWDQAGSSYVKLAETAAAAYVEAADCYKKASPMQAISCLGQAVNHFCNNGRIGMAAKYCKEVGELYEQQRDFEQAIKYFERAAEFFVGETATALASQCKQKVAQFSAQIKQYTKAIEIFEQVAEEAVNSNLLRYGIRGHLLNAGICHLCKGDLVVAANALERYQ